MVATERVIAGFEERFQAQPSTLISVPATLTLLGSHTDYHDGYVLLGNTDLYTQIALRPRSDRMVLVHDVDSGETETFNLDSFEHASGIWQNYLRGVAWAFNEQEHPIQGWEATLATDIPTHIELGQVPSLLVGFLYGFMSSAQLSLNHTVLAYLATRAMREWVGGHYYTAQVLSLLRTPAQSVCTVDLKTREVQITPFSRDSAVFLLDTQRRATDVEAILHQRTDEVLEVIRLFRVQSLRDLSMTRFEKDRDDLHDDHFMRARHILTENARVILATEMLKANAFVTVGRMMNDSHTSLRNNYSIGHDELDIATECARKQPNVYGARALNGLDGVVVAMVQNFSRDTSRKLSEIHFQKQVGVRPSSLPINWVGGVKVKAYEG